MSPTNAPAVGIKYCVVCGAGSHRTDWINKGGVGAGAYVACDKHTASEISAALAKLGQAAPKGGATPAPARPTVPMTPVKPAVASPTVKK